MELEAFFQTLLGGIGSGSIYALLGLSFALIFGRLTICSYMNGDLSILAAYLCFWLFTWWGMDPFLSAFLIMPLFFLIGYLVQSVFMKPFMAMEVWQGRYQAQVMVTWGLGMVILAAEYMLWSATYRTLGVSYRNSVLRVANLSVPYVDILAFLCIILIYIGLTLLLKKTTLGISLRACSDDRISSMLTGINYEQICAATFGISGILAVFAGLFFALTAQITPAFGVMLTFKGWMAVIIGGKGSLIGVILTGLFMGLVEALTSFFWIPALKEVVLLGILVIFLVAKPKGLLSKF